MIDAGVVYLTVKLQLCIMRVIRVTKRGADMQEQIWGPEEAEQAYNVKQATIRLWCRKGLFPAWKMGALWRFKRSDLEAFFKSNQQEVQNPKTNGLALTY